MKPVSSHPLRFKASRDRQYFSYARQVMMKSGIETSPLRQTRKSTMKCLNEQDLLRHMFRIKRLEAVQILNHFWSDSLRFPIFRTAMHHTMPYSSQCIVLTALLDPIH